MTWWGLILLAIGCFTASFAVTHILTWMTYSRRYGKWWIKLEKELNDIRETR